MSTVSAWPVDGVGFIAHARERQRELGYDAAHDDAHHEDELVAAALAYAEDLLDAREARAMQELVKDGVVKQSEDGADWWPFEREHWRPTANDPARGGDIVQLAKAGAFLAAEIDRLLREQQKPVGGV